MKTGFVLKKPQEIYINFVYFADIQVIFYGKIVDKKFALLDQNKDRKSRRIFPVGTLFISSISSWSRFLPLFVNTDQEVVENVLK